MGSLSLDVTFYPNPWSTSVHIRTNRPVDGAAFSMVDVLGREVIRRAGLSGEVFTVDRGSIPQGLYILQFTVGGQRVVKKLIVE